MQIGMIGLGKMGGNMSRRLMKAGHHCVVYARTVKTREALAKDGATAAASPAEMAKALKENVELGAGLEALARCSSSAVRRDTAAPDDVEIIHEELMLSRIRNFFHILIQSK